VLREETSNLDFKFTGKVISKWKEL